MLLNAGLKKGDAARLRSQTIPLLPNNPKSYCFHFWYNVYGVQTGQLNVNINYHGEKPETVWSEISGNKTEELKWRHGMVLIEDPYSSFEVRFLLDNFVSAHSYIYIYIYRARILTHAHSYAPSLSLSFSISFSLSFPLSLSLYFSLSLSVCLSVCLYIYGCIFVL